MHNRLMVRNGLKRPRLTVWGALCHLLGEVEYTSRFDLCEGRPGVRQGDLLSRIQEPLQRRN
jgi:hypothetical protein